MDVFQSTRPARGATALRAKLAQQAMISIHAPREGRDSKSEQISLHIFAKKAMSSDVFGAKRRLLKRFSAYNTGKPF